MRLLHTKTFEICQFYGDTIPEYALSHTWGPEEITFEDMVSQDAQIRANMKKKKAYFKVERCCLQAVNDEMDWVWIDTCCIDKNSSTELSEAINSMYHWYHKSAICYVYLIDVPAQNFDADEDTSWFRGSRWFTRGWTLQELIAPLDLIFYASDWSEIGTRRSLWESIQIRTQIHESILLKDEDPSSRSVAERMSWAAGRVTTREEDMAYCLLGLFRVNMPMLYGEGRRSFIRLQQEILRQEEDYSIMIWGFPGWVPDSLHCGILSQSPSLFTFRGGVPLTDQTANLPFNKLNFRFGQVRSFSATSRYFRNPAFDFINYKLCRRFWNPVRIEPPILTSRGLKTTLLVRYLVTDRVFEAWTFCTYGDVAETCSLLCITLETLPEKQAAHRLARTISCVPVKELPEFKPQEIYLSLESRTDSWPNIQPAQDERIRVHLKDSSCGVMDLLVGLYDPKLISEPQTEKPRDLKYLQGDLYISDAENKFKSRNLRGDSSKFEMLSRIKYYVFKRSYGGEITLYPHQDAIIFIQWAQCVTTQGSALTTFAVVILKVQASGLVLLKLSAFPEGHVLFGEKKAGRCPSKVHDTVVLDMLRNNRQPPNSYTDRKTLSLGEGNWLFVSIKRSTEIPVLEIMVVHTT